MKSIIWVLLTALLFTAGLPALNAAPHLPPRFERGAKKGVESARNSHRSPRKVAARPPNASKVRPPAIRKVAGNLRPSAIQNAATPPKPTPPTAVLGQQERAPEADDPEERNCSLSVVDWELSKILRALSEQTGANLVLLGTPGAKLTIRLSNVTLIEMLRHICALSGLKQLKVGNSRIVATEELLKAGYPEEWMAEHPEPVKSAPPAEAIVTRSYKLSYILGSSAGTVLEKFFGTDKLKVMAAPAPTSPVLGERDTAAITGVTQSTVGGAQGAPTGKLVVLQGTAETVQAAISLLKEIDVPRPQVVIGVTIYDISNDALRELGVMWAYNDVTVSESDPKGLGFGSFGRTSLQFTATLKALEKQNRAKLLASPTVSVLDGEQAFILIGQRINYPVLVGFSQSNTPIFSREQERVGIYMQVSANVSEDQKITLTLYPQVSTISGFLEVNGASYPQVSTREAQTTVRVKDGETIVIGGLLKDEEIVDVQQVPLLSQIPILGELFKRRKTTKTSSQVIIAIRPALIQPQEP